MLEIIVRIYVLNPLSFKKEQNSQMSCCCFNMTVTQEAHPHPVLSSQYEYENIFQKRRRE